MLDLTSKKSVDDNDIEFWTNFNNNTTRLCKVVKHIIDNGDEYVYIITNLTEIEADGFNGHMYFRYNNGEREIYKFDSTKSSFGYYGTGEGGRDSWFIRGASMGIIATNNPEMKAMEIPVDFLKEYEKLDGDIDQINVNYLVAEQEITQIDIMPDSVLRRAEKYVENYVSNQHDLTQPFLYGDFIQCYMFGAEFGKDNF